MAVSSRYLKYQTLKGGVVEPWGIGIITAAIRGRSFSPYKRQTLEGNGFRTRPLTFA